MRSLRRIKILGFFTLLSVLLAFSTVFADVSFTSNVEAINKTAESVLMLEVYDSNDQLTATGSGFIAFDNYTLVTNEHVIKDAEFIIGYSDAGNQYMITKIAIADAKRDIAILEFFSPTDLMPLLLADKNEEQRAELVVTIGSPLGLKNSVSLGNISAVFEEDGVSYIQFTAPISKGSSGGALLNDSGRVIGITSASLVEGQNINLAVDIDEVISLHTDSLGKTRIKLSQYAASLSTPMPTQSPTVTPTKEPIPKATIKPTKKPIPSQDPLMGALYFPDSDSFNHSVLKSYDGYSYDKFEKTWSYCLESFYLYEGMALSTITYGDTSMFFPPAIAIYNYSDATYHGAFIKSIEFWVDGRVYLFERLRYTENTDDSNYFYLGSVGKQMVEDIAKAKSLSVRLSMRDNSKNSCDIKPSATALKTWCRNIVKHKIFDYFIDGQLDLADRSHNAKIY